MKFFKIENGKGYFLDKNGKYQEIDGITKEDIFMLLDSATNDEINFEMDDVEDNVIHNQAHKIIYESLFKKFNELLKDRNIFIDETEKIYKDAFTKYQKE